MDSTALDDYLDLVTITRVEYETLKNIEALYVAQRPFVQAMMPSWAMEEEDARNKR